MMLTNRFDDAFQLAHDLHRTQTRKGSDIPYITHLMAVAGLVLEFGGDEDTAIAALLHDAVEDQGGQQTLNRIRTEFGDHVTQLVLACTDKVERTKADDAPAAWRMRKERDIAAIAGKSGQALLITACDKLHNLRTIMTDHRALGDALWTRFNGGRDGTIWYYREIVGVLGHSDVPSNLVEELAFGLESLLRQGDGSET